MAAIVDGVRQYPTWNDGQPTASEVKIFEDESLVGEDDDYQYLYNIGGEGFFRGANDWMTRATLDDTLGYKVRFLQTDAENNYVAISNYVLKFSEYRRTFADGVNGIWVDNNSGANNATWQVNLSSDGSLTFTISNAAYPDVLLGGIKGDVGTVGNNSCTSAGIYLNLVDPATTGFNSTWIAVSEEDYQTFTAARKANVAAYKAKVAQYEAAKALYDIIKEAETAGVSVDDQKAVYLNEDASVADIEAAVTAVRNAIVEFVNGNASNATLDNQIDISSTITGIIEITGGSNNGEVDNWTRVFTSTGTVGKFCLNTWSTEGNADGTNMLTPFIEDWVAKGSTLSDQYYYRDTVRVAPGAYRITANIRLYNESGAEDISGASLFANINASDLSTQNGTYLNYNNMLGYWKDGFETYAVVGEDSLLIFGILLKNANFNWAAAKDFHVYAMGNSYESVDRARQCDLRVATLGEGVYVSADIAQTYSGYVNTYKTGTSVSEIMAAASAIDAYYNTTVAENIAAWNAFLAAVEAAKVITGDQNVECEEKDELSDFVDIDVDEILTAMTLTTEELIEKTQWLDELRAAVIQNGLTPGTDFTQYLVNPDFSNGATGWSGSPTVNASCGEKYGSGSFDVYQEVKDAPVGVYEISMQGFYRQYRDDDAAVTAWYNVFTEDGEYKNPRPDTLGYVYMNDNKTAMNCVYDFQQEDGFYTTEKYSKDPLGIYVYPNTMAQAAEAFAVGAYQVSAFGLVAKKGDVLRVGVKGSLGPSSTNNHWVIFDNFKLTYQGKKAEIILPEFQKALASLNVAGLMGSDVKAEVETLKETANAIDQTDGSAMFDVLAEIFALNTKIENSVELFKTLKTSVENLEQAIGESQAVDATKSEASELYDAVTAAITGATYTDAQAEEAIAAIDAMITKLAIPDTTGASDDKEIPMTQVLRTPSFTNDADAASAEGWTQSVAGTLNYSGIEFYDKDFDIYQDLAGLPAGTYKITVQGFSRDGNTTQDAEAYNAGTPGKAKLYAVIDGVYYETSLAHNTSVENNFVSAPGYGTEVTWTTPAVGDEEGVTYYCPNNMQSVQGYFGEGLYLNELVVKLGEGQTLRLGVKVENKVSAQWIMIDNFTLTYYGNASAKETATNIGEVASAKVAKVEKFNVSGQRVSSMQQGVTIVRTTLTDGKVIVSKVFSK